MRVAKTREKSRAAGNFGKWKNQLQIQSMVLPGIIFLIIFSYIPMYGLIMAFKEYDLINGLQGTDWVGVKYFIEFFTDPNFADVMRNTIVLNLLALIFGFPVPVILAILICELKGKRFKKIVQTASYLPYFLSWVIFGGIVMEMLSSSGVISYVGQALGILDGPVNFMAAQGKFYAIYVIVTIIKTAGFNSILYIAAITGIDQEMFEAADIDGAGRIQKIIHLTLPSIIGTIVIMLIFQISSILNTGIEQMFVLQNSINLPVSETIDTYVYKVGLSQSRFSYATAVGLFKSVISVILLLIANKVSRKLTEHGLF